MVQLFKKLPIMIFRAGANHIAPNISKENQPTVDQSIKLIILGIICFLIFVFSILIAITPIAYIIAKAIGYI